MIKKTLIIILIFIGLQLKPAFLIAQPDTVKIGAYVISLHDINFHDKEYTLRYWLWLLHHNKDFDFSEQVEVPNAKSLEKPDIMIDTVDGKIWCLMKMKSVMKQSWDVKDYPFDRQHLSLKVENTIYDSKQLIFIADTLGSNYDSSLTVDGWDIKQFKVFAGHTDYNTAFGDINAKEQKSNYSNFNIDIILERNAWGLFFKLFIGMYIAFLISSVSLMISVSEADPRFGLPVGGLFAAVGNKYIIDSLLPESSSFTLVDTLHSITYFFIFLTIALNAISLIYSRSEREAIAKKTNKKGVVKKVLYSPVSRRLCLNLSPYAPSLVSKGCR